MDAGTRVPSVVQREPVALLESRDLFDAVDFALLQNRESGSLKWFWATAKMHLCLSGCCQGLLSSG